MMMHHDGRPYEVAAAEAAVKGRAKLSEIIDRGKAKASTAILGMAAEYEARRDFFLPGTFLAGGRVRTDQRRVVVNLNDSRPEEEFHFTDHAWGQFCSRVGMPTKYADALLETGEEWADVLVKDNLRTLAERSVGGEHLLFREVNGTVKGVLSQAYRRLDAAPLFESAMGTALEQGLVPVDGENTSTKYHLKVLLPRIYEPVENEVMAFGISLTTSDYGAGAMALNLFAMRLWCTNCAIAENLLRKGHMGRRYEGPEFSNQTVELDGKALASAVHDIIGTLPALAESQSEAIRQADLIPTNPKEAAAILRKGSKITKGEEEAAVSLFSNVPNESGLLPPNPSKWRWSNVLSLMSQSAGDGDRRLELQTLAGEAIR